MSGYTASDAADAPLGTVRIIGSDLDVVAYLIAGGDLSVAVNKGGILVARMLVRGAMRLDLDLIAENIAGHDAIVHLGGRKG